MFGKVIEKQGEKWLVEWEDQEKSAIETSILCFESEVENLDENQDLSQDDVTESEGSGYFSSSAESEIDSLDDVSLSDEELTLTSSYKKTTTLNILLTTVFHLHNGEDVVLTFEGYDIFKATFFLTMIQQLKGNYL